VMEQRQWSWGGLYHTFCTRKRRVRPIIALAARRGNALRLLAQAPPDRNGPVRIAGTCSPAW
jgi:hypothetical protein